MLAPASALRLAGTSPATFGCPAGIGRPRRPGQHLPRPYTEGRKLLTHRHHFRSWLALCIVLILSPGAATCRGQDLMRQLGEAFHGVGDFFGKIPVGHSADDGVEALAKQIDSLEHHLESYGSVIAKHPDVWGQSRLTKFRQEFEREFAQLLSKDNFDVTLQGSLRRSDQSFLAQALSLDVAADSGGGGGTTTAETLIEDVDGSVIFNRNPTSPVDLNRFQGVNQISLEPTLEADQMKRYFDHLNELRRINEGDDTADSAGYSLNLVRIPISVLPGKRTTQGYGAEITITAHPHLSPELLPETFRNLVANDLVDHLSLPITVFLNRPDASKALQNLAETEQGVEQVLPRLEYYKEQLRQQLMVLRSLETARGWFSFLPPHITDPVDYLEIPDFRSRIYSAAAAGFEMERQGGHSTQTHTICRDIWQLHRDIKHLLSPESQADALKWAFYGARIAAVTPATRDRRSSLPFPPSQLSEVFGLFALGYVAQEADARLRRFTPAHHPHYIHLMDVRRFLNGEIQAAYKLLSLPQNYGLWERFCTPELVTLVRNRDGSALGDMRDAFYLSPELIGHAWNGQAKCTRTLAWAIIVESALLNDRLLSDMRLVAAQKGCLCPPQCWLPFFGPIPPPEARAAFNQYVMCRWPIIVFALDPSTQDQNIADVFAQRREMQLALAVGVAQGRVRASSATRYARRLETDMETIALNRTHVGFSHGNDIFGWRFYPRYQTPPIPGTLTSLHETIWGSDPGRDLKTRQLEPGIRECVAIVIMPSFIPHVTFQSRSSWFCLENPSKKILSLHDTMKLRRNMANIRWAAHHLSQTYCYRPGDVSDLLQTVEYLDRRMPFQNMLVQIPFENTLGGFELFRTGVTDLAPELHGWYGAPGITIGEDPVCHNEGLPYMRSDYAQCRGTCGGTTLFLVGNGFSVHDTKVIAGGRCVPFMLLSRQVMQVTVPGSAQQVRTRVTINPDETVVDDRVEHFVDVHVATPYGVSNHLLIPVANVVNATCEQPTPAPDPDPPPAETSPAATVYGLRRLAPAERSPSPHSYEVNDPRAAMRRLPAITIRR